MRWLRVFAVWAWLFEMISVVRYLDTQLMLEVPRFRPLFGCPRPWQDDPTIYECTLANSHRAHVAWLVIAVCTATTLAVLLLTWLPFRGNPARGRVAGQGADAAELRLTRTATNDPRVAVDQLDEAFRVFPTVEVRD